MTSQRTGAAANTASSDPGNIFWTALRLIGRGFVEIAQGIGLIAEGTLRPVRSFVPSFVALASIAALTTVTLVLVVTTVAQADTRMHRDNGAWTRWNSSPEIRVGGNVAIAYGDFVLLTDAGETQAPRSEAITEDPIDSTYTALWIPEP